MAAAVGRSEDAVDDVDPKINHRQAMWSADVDVSIDPDSPRKTPYSHSIVNGRVSLIGKTGRAPAEDRLDTDKSTVAFECTSSACLHSISPIKGSQLGVGSEYGMVL